MDLLLTMMGGLRMYEGMDVVLTPMCASPCALPGLSGGLARDRIGLVLILLVSKEMLEESIRGMSTWGGI